MITEEMISIAIHACVRAADQQPSRFGMKAALEAVFAMHEKDNLIIPRKHLRSVRGDGKPRIYEVVEPEDNQECTCHQPNYYARILGESVNTYCINCLKPWKRSIKPNTVKPEKKTLEQWAKSLERPHNPDVNYATVVFVLNLMSEWWEQR